MTTDTDRDPQRPARLLLTERDALLPILRRTPAEAFARPTVLPGWSVRDVLAHCAAVLTRTVTGQLPAFTPELNEMDIAERRSLPVDELLSELSDSYADAASAISAAGGRLDAIALGEWTHGGDLRDALGEPDAYASDGFDDACLILADWSRRRGLPLVEASLPDRTLALGIARQHRPAATLRCSGATLMRLFAGRSPAPADYELTGADPGELVVF